MKQINVAKLKKMPKNKKQQKIEELEMKKTGLIEKYMELQDLVDKYNKEVYDVSCEIEQINIVINELTPKKPKNKNKVHIKQ